MCAASLTYSNKLHPWCWVILTAHGSALIPNIIPAYFLAGRGIGVTPTCSSAVYGAP